MLLGNAAAPRWYELNDARLDQYLHFLVGAGATSAEIVLHHGPIDDRGRRVHVLEHDWERVSQKMQAHDLACQLHASLDSRFGLHRWSSDRSALMADYWPLFNAAIKIGERQTSPAAFVVHATSSAVNYSLQGTEDSMGFLDWAADVVADANVVICPELRPSKGRFDLRWDRSRGSMASVVSTLARPNVGICWDLGHDWENRDKECDPSSEPSETFLNWIRHVHVHDAGRQGELHHPLGSGGVPWAEQVRLLRGRSYSGALTMEIRYRYALAAGEPWTVLASCYRRALEQMT